MLLLLSLHFSRPSLPSSSILTSLGGLPLRVSGRGIPTESDYVSDAVLAGVGEGLLDLGRVHIGACQVHVGNATLGGEEASKMASKMVREGFG